MASLALLAGGSQEALRREGWDDRNQKSGEGLPQLQWESRGKGWVQWQIWGSEISLGVGSGCGQRNMYLLWSCHRTRKERFLLEVKILATKHFWLWLPFLVVAAVIQSWDRVKMLRQEAKSHGLPP